MSEDGPAAVEAPPDDDQAESVAYAWTIRALYAVGLAANIYLLWTIIKDRPETQIAVARWKLRFAAAKAKLENCEGCAKRKAMVNQVVYEAMSIVGHGREQVADDE